jgi:phage shock protein PspC (stress-responsive transcriptional regulator)
MIGGVCAGLARYFGWDVTTIRVVCVLSTVLPGPQFIGYLALWAVMPVERRAMGG